MSVVRSRRSRRMWQLAIPVLIGIAAGVLIVVGLVTVGPLKPTTEPTQAATTYEQVRAKEDPILYSYGWVDKNAGIAHIPIQRAIDIVAQKGLPARPSSAQPARDQGLTLPSYSSSGTQPVSGLH